MEYRIVLVESGEGWAVSCPALAGCHSQGETREEAVENIKAAICEWLGVEAEAPGVSSVEQDVVSVPSGKFRFTLLIESDSEG